MSDRIATVNAVNATLPFIWSNGLKYDSAGRIVVTTTEPVANFSNGLPRSLAGDLCVTEV